MHLFTEHKVKVFVYNQQVTDPLPQSFLERARKKRHSRGRRLRDHAEPGYHLSDMDAGRGERAATAR